MWVTLECESREGEKMKGMIHLKRRVTVAILAFAMVIAMLPVLGEKAYAVTSAPYLSLIAVDDNAAFTEDDILAYYLTEDERTALQAPNGRLAEIAAQTEANNAILADPKNSY